MIKNWFLNVLLKTAEDRGPEAILGWQSQDSKKVLEACGFVSCEEFYEFFTRLRGIN